MTNKIKPIVQIAIVISLIITVSSGLAIIFSNQIYVGPEYEDDEYKQHVVDNYLIMRDLFTPAYNDTVIIEPAGYIDGDWTFWVNHSRVLDSYYFENVKSYHVAIPMFGEIHLVNGSGYELDDLAYSFYGNFTGSWVNVE